MSKRGFTLFELMVALALGAIILVVLANAVVPLTRQILAGFQEMELAREAQVVATSFGQDLAMTPFEGRDFAMARWVMRPLLEQPVSGQRAYGPALVSYELADGILTRRVHDASRLPVSFPARAEWTMTGTGSSRRLAMGVSSFQCTLEGVLSVELTRGRLRYRLHRVFGSRNP